MEGERNRQEDETFRYHATSVDSDPADQSPRPGSENIVSVLRLSIEVILAVALLVFAFYISTRWGFILAGSYLWAGLVGALLAWVLCRPDTTAIDIMFWSKAVLLLTGFFWYDWRYGAAFLALLIGALLLGKLLGFLLVRSLPMQELIYRRLMEAGRKSWLAYLLMAIVTAALIGMGCVAVFASEPLSTQIVAGICGAAIGIGVWHYRVQQSQSLDD